MQKSTFAIVSFLLLGCSSTPELILPSSLSSKTEVSASSYPIEQVLPGGNGMCYGAWHSSTAWWMVLRQKDQANQLVLAYAGPEGSWQYKLPLEAEGTEVTRLEIEEFRVGDVLDDATPEVALVVKTVSKAQGGNVVQTRRALYLVGVGRIRQLLWYGTVSLNGQLTEPCRTETVRYVGDVAWQMMGPLVTGVTVNRRRVSEVCKGGSGCESGRQCTTETSQDERGWVYNDERGAFRLFGQDQGVMKFPDVGLE